MAIVNEDPAMVKFLLDHKPDAKTVKKTNKPVKAVSEDAESDATDTENT